MNYKLQFTKFLKLAGIFEQDQNSKSSVFMQPLNLWLDIIHNQWIKISKLRNVKILQIPTLLPLDIFNKELSHISKNFETQVYAVNKNYILKPTSEMILYNSQIIKKSVKSYLDLPLRVMLKNRVYRKQTRTYPLVRHNEIFHFAQTHEIFQDNTNLEVELTKILQAYISLCHIFQLTPLQITRFEGDRFSGSINSIALDLFIPSANKRLQIVSVHNLSNNFSKILNLKYKGKSNELFDCQNISHGYSERFIGGIIMSNLDLDTKTLTLPHILRLKQLVIVDLQLALISLSLDDFECIHIINKTQYKRTLQSCLLRDSFTFIYGVLELKSSQFLFFNRSQKQYIGVNEVSLHLTTTKQKSSVNHIQKLDNLNNIVDNIPYMFDMKFYSDLKSLNLKSKIWGYIENTVYFGPTF